jgi:spore coat protein U-like protein
MNTLLKTTLIAATLASLNVNAGISVGDDNTAEFTFGGTIAKMCKVTSTNAETSTLVLGASPQTQPIGTMEVWCNTGSNATTKYASANNGVLKSGDNEIAYTLTVGSIKSDMSLTTEQTLSATAAGSNRAGDSEAHILQITPQSNGLDLAGTYSDTITVTVSFN